MARLIVNPDTDSAWEAELGPGRTSLGRGEANDIPLDHESVSSAHCEINVTDAGVFLKDLGSVSGTFLGEELVEQARLKDGDLVRVGEVCLKFCADAPVASPMQVRIVGSKPARTTAPAAVAVPETTSGGGVPAPMASPSAGFCLFHPRIRARLECPQCRHTFCDSCVNSHFERGAMRKFCRKCGVECAEYVPAELPEESGPGEDNLIERVRESFRYPLVGDGLVLLISVTLFYSLIRGARWVASFAGLFGYVAVAILFVYGTGYLVSFMRSIVASSAAGEKRMPNWPDFTDVYSDILSPFLQLLGTALVSFVPAIALSFLPWAEAQDGGWPVKVGLLVGGIYFPMAFLGVTIFDSIAAVNPIVVVPAITRVAQDYVACVIVFAGFLAARTWGESTLLQFMPRFLAVVLSAFVGFYLLVAEMRLLGLLYHHRAAEMGWATRSYGG